MDAFFAAVFCGAAGFVVVFGLLPQVGDDVSVGHQVALIGIAVQVDHVGLDAVGALPHRDRALVVDLVIVVGGFHFVGLGLQRLVA